MNRIAIVSAADWQGLYVNGELEYEYHEVWQKLPEYCPILSIDMKWLSNKGYDGLLQSGRFDDWGKANLSDFLPEEIYRA